MSHYSSLSTWINVVESLLDEIGYDSKKILIDNFNEEIIYGGRSKVETIGKAWRLLAEKSNKPAIGIIAAEKYFQPTNWNALGLAVLCSSTLREAMNRIMNLGDVVSDVTTITIKKHEYKTELVMSPKVNAYILGYEATDFGIASIVKLFRICFPGEINPLCIELIRPSVENSKLYEEFFNSEVKFNSKDIKIIYRNDDLDLSLPMANNELAEHQDRMSLDYIARMENITCKVSDLILILIRKGKPPSLQNVSKKLNMSFRTLQRKLELEDTSFKELLTDARRQLANEYIKQEYRSVKEIAYLLGFSEHSNFNRAFKRWFDVSPSQFRENLSNKNNTN